MTRIRLTRPSVGDEELAEIARVMGTGYLTQGPVVAEFEKLVADYLGVRHAFAMSSATTALHLSLVAMGIGLGDEVVVPAYTFPATANVVIQAGATVVFCDVDPRTLAMTAETLDAVLTPRTAAVMPVDPGGYPAPMREIVELAAGRDIRVVEDAACGLGATRNGVPCGSFADAGCFSFHPRKVITTGEGGMIMTDNDDLADRVALLRSHGGRRSDGRFVYEAAGFNYRLSDVGGAMGVAQMRKLDAILERRRSLARLYDELLDGVGGVTAPFVEPSSAPTYQSYVVMFDDALDRDGIIKLLSDLGVETTLGTYGLHLEPFFRELLGVEAADFPNATRAATQSLTLPLFPDMPEEDVEGVVAALRGAVRQLS